MTQQEVNSQTMSKS